MHSHLRSNQASGAAWGAGAGTMFGASLGLLAPSRGFGFRAANMGLLGMTFGILGGVGGAAWSRLNR